MKKQFALTNVVLIAGLITGHSGENSTQAERAPRNVTLAVSPDLPNKAEIAIAVTSWLVRQADCKANLIDGWTCQSISEFEIPRVTYFKEASVARKIGQPLDNWVEWTKKSSVDPTLDESGAVNVPMLLTRLAQEHATPDYLIIIGSPIARFPSQTNYDFQIPVLRYPADGQIVFDKLSPFSSQGAERSLSGTRILFLYPGIDFSKWPADYESKLHHFYGTFFQSRNGNLMAFTPNLEAGLKLLNEKRQLPFMDFPTNSTQIGMLKAGSLSPDVTEDASINPPSVTSSNLPPIRPVEAIVETQPKEAIQTPTANTNVGRTHRVDDSSVSVPDTISHRFPPTTPNPTAASSNDATTNIILPRIVLPQAGVTIQLRYHGRQHADIDLFLKPYAEAEEISFTKSRTALGSYDYFYDFASEEHVKSINLTTGCDPSKAVAWLNFRSGYGNVSAKVLLLTPTDIKETPASFFANRGGDDDRRRDYSRNKSACWHRVNLLALLTAKVPNGASSKVLPEGKASKN